MSIYEEVEIEDLDYDPITQIYTYPCPCGDKFTISLEALWDGEDIATCPSCTLRIEIIYDEENLPPLLLRKDDDEEDDDEQGEGESDGNKKDVSESEQRGETRKEEIDVDISTTGMKSLVVR
jgi:diphthamide biosynthesis protein 3